MSRAHPRYFPDDTPDPVAESWDSIGELLQLVRAWIAFSAVCAVLAIAIAFFCPSLFTLFR